MKIDLAKVNQLSYIQKYDRHITQDKLKFCIENQFVYVLKDKERVVGILRYNLFWQEIPFLDLLFIDPLYRGKCYGKEMMEYWENHMISSGYSEVMLSTQEDETAKDFYRKLGYQQVGSFLPLNQDVLELIFCKSLTKS